MGQRGIDSSVVSKTGLLPRTPGLQLHPPTPSQVISPTPLWGGGVQGRAPSVAVQWPGTWTPPSPPPRPHGCRGVEDRIPGFSRDGAGATQERHTAQGAVVICQNPVLFHHPRCAADRSPGQGKAGR